MTIYSPEDIRSDVEGLVPEVTMLRREIHQHPETAFEEVHTAELVAKHLTDLGLEVHTGIARTGVVGILKGEANYSEKKIIAIRADMDALPIQEENDVVYRSRVDGKMHACGHDGHTAIALTVATLLSRRRSELRGDVVFIFQPAEEVAKGARAMLKEDIIKEMKINAILGLHLVTALPVGRIGVVSGSFFASLNQFQLTIKGKGGYPFSSTDLIDPVMIASQITNALYTLMSRETTLHDPVFLHVGSINAGSDFTTIPEQAVIQGTLRAFSVKQQQRMFTRIREVAEGIANALGGSCEVEANRGCPPCTNDVAISQLVGRAANATVGPNNVDYRADLRTLGSDDMGYFLQKFPGCFFLVGARNEEKETRYPQHHPRFNIDEHALAVGVEVLARAISMYLH